MPGLSELHDRVRAGAAARLPLGRGSRLTIGPLCRPGSGRAGRGLASPRPWPSRAWARWLRTGALSALQPGPGLTRLTAF